MFEYHGAEHKVISCYEAGEPLEPENAQRYSRLHMRCGTSFLLIVMIIGVFVFAPIGRPALHWLILSRIVGHRARGRASPTRSSAGPGATGASAGSAA